MSRGGVSGTRHLGWVSVSRSGVSDTRHLGRESMSRGVD
jgi:hypothetical protein